MEDTQEQVYASMREALLRATGEPIRDEEVDFHGNRIVLPEGTSIRDNITFLERLEQDQDESTEFEWTYNYKVWDVAKAMNDTFRKQFGAVRHHGSWLQPPQLVAVPCGPNESVQVPFGYFVIPVLPDITFQVLTSIDPKLGKVGKIEAAGPKKWKRHVNGIFKLVEEALEQDSLYRGMAFVDDDKPEFIDTEAIDPSKIVYSNSVNSQLEANVFGRIDYPEAMAAYGVKFRCAVLLEGEFGVGKTEALSLVAKRCVEKGVTFIKVPSGGNVIQAIQTARMYQPAVVAAEDLDRDAGADNDKIQEILEAFDGQQAKLNEVMGLLTTNYVKTLHKGMVRPGRIDAIINIGPPDAEGIRKLVEARTPHGKLDASIDWDAVASAMEGYFPSFVVEATSRAIRYAVVRAQGHLNGHSLVTEDLVEAAIELRPQFDLHRDASTGEEEPDLDRALGNVVQRYVHGSANRLDELQSSVTETVRNAAGEVEATVDKRAGQLAKHTHQEHEQSRDTTVTDGERTREIIR